MSSTLHKCYFPELHVVCYSHIYSHFDALNENKSKFARMCLFVSQIEIKRKIV